MRRFLISTFVIIALVIAGFLFLLKGCLSEYDERSAIAPTYYFEKGGKSVIFSIVKFDEATSYVQRGGFTSKTVSTTYHVQKNDAKTGEKLGAREIKKHKDIKNYPIEMMGQAGSVAWVFLGEPMAFDPFTLAQIADAKTIEKSNPALKGRLPADRRYYEFDHDTKLITITAKDGTVWSLDTKTLIAQQTDEDVKKKDKDPVVTALEKELKKNNVDMDSLLERKLRRPSRMLNAKQISVAQYHKMTQEFKDEREVLYDVRDSLQKLLSRAEKEKSARENIRRNLNNLRGKIGVSFSQIKCNMDTINGRWYGMYSPAELEKQYERIQVEGTYGDASRRQFYTSGYFLNKSEDYVFDKENAEKIPLATPFLEGGFLMDKNTGRPIKLPGGGFLVVSKKEVGYEGKILVSRLALDGKAAWTFDTNMNNWSDWIITPTHLYIIGVDNKELSGSDINVLYLLDLNSGKTIRYDFFTDKLQ